jgi:hypothetical protein
MGNITRRAVITAIALAGAATVCPPSVRPTHAQQSPAVPPEPPWESRRGVRNIDYNNHVIFVRAPMDDMAHALAGRTERWERNVLGREIALSRNSALVFRLRGHAWTVVVPAPSPFVWDEGALSGLLKTRIIGYGVSDTTGSVGYALYESGELVEQFDASEGSSGRPDGSSRFTSRLRTLKLEDIANIWKFTSQFLVDQDVLEPGIGFEYFLSSSPRLPLHQGEAVRARIVNPGFSMMMPGGSRSVPDVPPIERVDHWVPRERRQ